MQAVIKIKAMGFGFFGLIWFGVFCWVFCVLFFLVGFAFEGFFFICVCFVWFLLVLFYFKERDTRQKELF